ncbi:uncharacterized protein [Dysidea avara]|uniref:uncharacterized protein n=1 Tax=Dysidea avara TaxID=196820 RepID=UPI00331CFC82
MYGQVVRFTLVCSLLWTTCVAFSMSFTSKSYQVKILAIEGIRGKELLKVEFNESKRLVKEFVTKDYSINHAYTYFTIDNSGTVYIKENLPNKNRRYSFQVTALYTVLLYSGETHTGFAHADVNVQGIGPLHFDNSTYRIMLLVEQRVNDSVFDFGQHIVISTDDYHDIHYQFPQLHYSYYFHIDNTTGKLFISRALPPAKTFSIYISFNYNATLMNGTIIKDGTGVYAIITAAGCKYSLEANTVWKSSLPCTSQRVPCSKVTNTFGSGHITRFCGVDGKWSAPNYSQCKVREQPGTFVIAWINFDGVSGLINLLKNITRDLSTLFPTHGITKVTVISGSYLEPPHHDYHCYAFTVGLKLTVNSLIFNGTSSNNVLKLANHQLNVQRIIGGIHTCPIRDTRGIIRIFNVTSTCEDKWTQHDNGDDDNYVVHLCSGDNCNCTNYNTTANTDSCKEVLMKRKKFALHRQSNQGPLVHSTVSKTFSNKDDSEVISAIKRSSP